MRVSCVPVVAQTEGEEERCGGGRVCTSVVPADAEAAGARSLAPPLPRLRLWREYTQRLLRFSTASSTCPSSCVRSVELMRAAST